jgi:hypothetical protein
MSSFISKLAADPDFQKKVLIARDDSAPGAQRLLAYYEIAKIAERYMIPDPEWFDKPKYIWRNGAKVKVR